jgi:ATP synthase F1 delta subunit
VARKKFPTEKWAEAFFAVTGKDAEKAFLCLEALSAPVKSIQGVFYGYAASRELEKTLRDCLTACGDENDTAVEYAVRFICLLVEKKCFRYINSFLRRIEQRLDEQKGILNVIVETAAPMDSENKKELMQMIKEKTGAADVKMINRVKPELLGGYLLRIGAFFIDASLKGQLDNMRSALNEAVLQSAAEAGRQ